MGKFVFVLILGLFGLVLKTRADCGSNLAGNSALTKCMHGVIVSMQGLNKDDPLSVCKDKVKQHMTCLKEFLQSCPELAAEGGHFHDLKPLLDEYHKNCEGSAGLFGPFLKTRADCVSNLAGNSALTKCMHGLIVSMQGLNKDDPLSVCKDKVKQHMTCLKEFLQSCPELAAEGGHFHDLKPLLDEYHKNCEGSAASGSCPGYNTCVKNVTVLSLLPEGAPSGNSTPFSILPAAVFNLCKVFKIQLGCNDAYRTKCPKAVNFAENAVSESLAKERSIDLDLAEIKRLVREECPKIPSDFSSNKCVRRNLESSGFVSCILNVKKLSSKAPKSEQCRYYHEGKACIHNHIGRPCGTRNAEVIVDTAHLVIHDLPEACDMKVVPPGKNRGDMMVDDAPPDGSSRIQFTMDLLWMLALAFILQRF